MKVIIIILQAILNLVRKRRDLIANRSKIPPEYRDDVVVWYSPKKQRLTNYDVIESYAEDFTYWTINNTSITSTQKKIVIPAGTELKYVIAYRGFNSSTDGFDVINATANKNAFDLYKYSRDSKDELAGQIGELKTELAVLKATRPYQDALIQCDIRRVAEHADFNLWRRTCRMISGEVVLPNTPTVTGYASYNPCACPATTTTSTTAA